ncbi:MAG: mechanosensitive ion channel [Deltaproteobacteria bacterium]|nr:mechanosensitive ion channel [Deltaproteobacteria bacterium]
MDFLNHIFSDFIAAGRYIDAKIIAVLFVNITLLIFAKRILKSVYHTQEEDKSFLLRLNIFRTLNLLIIFSFGYYHLTKPLASKGWAFKAVSILIIIYLCYFSAHIIHYLIRSRYGRSREINGEKQIIDTYNSRLINILITTFITIIVMISVVRILGFSSLLEAGGVLGFIGVFLALTQSTWAPDILSGLIVLNSGMIEVGDVIELDDSEKTLGIIHKTKVFHTEILNIKNNHRIMIKNSRLRDYQINNLSKFASAKGLRERLTFNIDYSAGEEQVKEMFLSAFEEGKTSGISSIEYQHPLEIGVLDTADYAVTWAIYYYTKALVSQRLIE